MTEEEKLLRIARDLLDRYMGALRKLHDTVENGVTCKFPSTLVYDQILEQNPHAKLLQWDGYESCVIGTGERCGQPILLCYDRQAMIELTMTRDGMDRDEAQEYIDYNLIGGWLGDSTPIAIETYNDVYTRRRRIPSKTHAGVCSYEYGIQGMLCATIRSNTDTSCIPY